MQRAGVAEQTRHPSLNMCLVAVGYWLSGGSQGLNPCYDHSSCEHPDQEQDRNEQKRRAFQFDRGRKEILCRLEK